MFTTAKQAFPLNIRIDGTWPVPEAKVIVLNQTVSLLDLELFIQKFYAEVSVFSSVSEVSCET